MYLIVGLGNPEEEYANTRHNMGFDVINQISNKYNINVNKEKFEGLYGTGTINNEKVILLKPQTYMNLSGECIIKFKEYYKLETENIIVIYDDMDIEPGNIKIRKQGGPGGHNGMKSVVQCLKSEKFSRIRIGICKPIEKNNMINYVIGHVSDEKLKVLNEGINKAAISVEDILKFGIDIAMSKNN